jgi:hypothetical protein
MGNPARSSAQAEMPGPVEQEFNGKSQSSPVDPSQLTALAFATMVGAKFPMPASMDGDQPRLRPERRLDPKVPRSKSPTSGSRTGSASCRIGHWSGTRCVWIKRLEPFPPRRNDPVLLGWAPLCFLTPARCVLSNFSTSSPCRANRRSSSPWDPPPNPKK